MMLNEIRRVVEILDAAGVPGNAYFDMQHDILYIPFEEERGDVADQLEAAGCHWESESGSWATF